MGFSNFHQYSWDVMRTPEQHTIAKILGWVALATTILVVPWASYDPINVPKLAVIVIGGFMALAIVASQKDLLLDRKFKTPLFIGALFIVDLVLVLVFAGNNFNQEFFGTYGRATGFIAYLALAGLLILGIISASSYSFKRVSWFLVYAGALSIAYGVSQVLGADPVKWVLQYSPVIGFVGNPDFQSSFVGLSAVMAFAILLKETRIEFKVALTIFLITAMYVIYETKAQQGFLVLLGGVAVILLLVINKSKARKLTLPLVGAGVIGGFLVVIGSLNLGPLASILHKESVIYRGDYWRAGWTMTIQHPIFGVGLDSYGDWYRRSRTLEATLRRGPEIVSNAAHNVLLDFSSNGGFPLLIIYLALMFLVIRAAFKTIRRSTSFDPYFSGLFAVWISYQAQSVISLNQLGLAVWGWIISGLIIGWEISSRSILEDLKIEQHSKKRRTASNLEGSKLLPATSLSLFVGLLVGCLVGLPPLSASSKFKSALESGNAKVIVNSANNFPRDSTRTIQIAYVLHQNKLDDQAMAVIKGAARDYPDSFDVWKVLVSLSNVTPAQVSEAKAQMKRLDPHNPNLK